MTLTSRGESLESVPESVPELTNNCISKLQGFSAPDGEDGAHNVEMENRLADLRLWADGVGATAEGPASLEWRFRSRPDDLMLVKTVLIMLGNFVDDYAMQLIAGQPLDDAVGRIDSAIENLALIGVAIRRTGKASRRRRADKKFNLDKYEDFRTHLECMILLRPSKSGLPEKLDRSRLSSVQKTLITANLMRRHRFVVAQKRSNKSRAPASQGEGEAPDIDEEDQVPGQGQGAIGSDQHNAGGTKQKGKRGEAPTIGGLTAASTAEGTLQVGSVSGRKYVAGAARTQIPAMAADSDFPKPPRNVEGRHIGKCPCCCQSILVEEMRDSTKWRQHIVEDLLPYTCIVEDCPTPTTLFCNRKEWEAHIKADHPIVWRCPLCEDEEVVFADQEEIVYHFEMAHYGDLQELTLATLLPWSESQQLGITSCPLCPSFGVEDSPEIINHVLQHVYEFSLRALPWTRPVVHDMSRQLGTFKLPTNEHFATRLANWVADAYTEEATDDAGVVELQLTEQELEYRPEVLEDIDGYGYVPDDEYFLGEFLGGSSRPENAFTSLRPPSLSTTSPRPPSLRTTSPVTELFSAEDASLVRRWIMRRLGNSTMSNLKAHADYIMRFINHSRDEKITIDYFDQVLPEFLVEDPETFVRDLFQAIRHRSYISEAADPPPQPAVAVPSPNEPPLARSPVPVSDPVDLDDAKSWSRTTDLIELMRRQNKLQKTDHGIVEEHSHESESRQSQELPGKTGGGKQEHSEASLEASSKPKPAINKTSSARPVSPDTPGSQESESIRYGPPRPYIPSGWQMTDHASSDEDGEIEKLKQKENPSLEEQSELKLRQGLRLRELSTREKDRISSSREHRRKLVAEADQDRHKQGTTPTEEQLLATLQQSGGDQRSSQVMDASDKKKQSQEELQKGVDAASAITSAEWTSDGRYDLSRRDAAETQKLSEPVLPEAQDSRTINKTTISRDERPRRETEGRSSPPKSRRQVTIETKRPKEKENIHTERMKHLELDEIREQIQIQEQRLGELRLQREEAFHAMSQRTRQAGIERAGPLWMNYDAEIDAAEARLAEDNKDLQNRLRAQTRRFSDTEATADRHLAAFRWEKEEARELERLAQEPRQGGTVERSRRGQQLHYDQGRRDLNAKFAREERDLRRAKEHERRFLEAEEYERRELELRERELRRQEQRRLQRLQERYEYEHSLRAERDRAQKEMAPDTKIDALDRQYQEARASRLELAEKLAQPPRRARPESSSTYSTTVHSLGHVEPTQGFQPGHTLTSPDVSMPYANTLTLGGDSYEEDDNAFNDRNMNPQSDLSSGYEPGSHGWDPSLPDQFSPQAAKHVYLPPDVRISNEARLAVPYREQERSRSRDHRVTFSPRRPIVLEERPRRETSQLRERIVIVDNPPTIPPRPRLRANKREPRVTFSTQRPIIIDERSRRRYTEDEPRFTSSTSPPRHRRRYMEEEESLERRQAERENRAQIYGHPAQVERIESFNPQLRQDAHLSEEAQDRLAEQRQLYPVEDRRSRSYLDRNNDYFVDELAGRRMRERGEDILRRDGDLDRFEQRLAEMERANRRERRVAFEDEPGWR